MSRVKCYVVTEITDGEPVGTHVFSFDEDGKDEMCEMVAKMIEENGYKPVMESDIELAVSKYSYYRFKGHKSDDWAIHVHKATRE